MISQKHIVMLCLGASLVSMQTQGMRRFASRSAGFTRLSRITSQFRTPKRNFSSETSKINSPSEALKSSKKLAASALAGLGVMSITFGLTELPVVSRFAGFATTAILGGPTAALYMAGGMLLGESAREVKTVLEKKEAKNRA